MYISIGILLGISLSVLMAEFSYRRYGHAEGARKFLHCVGGVSFFVALKYLPVPSLITLGIIIVSGMLISRQYHICQLLNQKISRGYGELYFIIGLLIVLVIYQYSPAGAISTLGIMVFADGLAPFGRYLIPQKIYHTKTLGGSLVFFLITFGILLISGRDGLQALALSIMLTVTELISDDGWDNISVPIITFLLLFFF